jgi:hypothetical protein
MIKMKFNFKKLGIVLFLLILVAGFSLSSINSKNPGPDVRDGGTYTLYTEPLEEHHSVTFNGIAGFDITSICTVTPVDTNNVISWTKNSNGSYTFTGVKESNTPVSYAVNFRNPYTGQIITIIYTFEVKDGKKQDVEVNMSNYKGNIIKQYVGEKIILLFKKGDNPKLSGRLIKTEKGYCHELKHKYEGEEVIITAVKKRDIPAEWEFAIGYNGTNWRECPRVMVKIDVYSK